MDFRYKTYYFVKFENRHSEFRISQMKFISSIKFHSNKDEDTLIISVDKKDVESIEYELRKAERNDGYCKWFRLYKQIKYDGKIKRINGIIV